MTINQRSISGICRFRNAIPCREYIFQNTIDPGMHQLQSFWELNGIGLKSLHITFPDTVEDITVIYHQLLYKLPDLENLSLWLPRKICRPIAFAEGHLYPNGSNLKLTSLELTCNYPRQEDASLFDVSAPTKLQFLSGILHSSKQLSTLQINDSSIPFEILSRSPHTLETLVNIHIKHELETECLQSLQQLNLKGMNLQGLRLDFDNVEKFQTILNPLLDTHKNTLMYLEINNSTYHTGGEIPNVPGALVNTLPEGNEDLEIQDVRIDSNVHLEKLKVLKIGSHCTNIVCFHPLLYNIQFPMLEILNFGLQGLIQSDGGIQLSELLCLPGNDSPCLSLKELYLPNINNCGDPNLTKYGALFPSLTKMTLVEPSASKLYRFVPEWNRQKLL